MDRTDVRRQPACRQNGVDGVGLLAQRTDPGVLIAEPNVGDRRVLRDGWGLRNRCDDKRKMRVVFLAKALQHFEVALPEFDADDAENRLESHGSSRLLSRRSVRRPCADSSEKPDGAICVGSNRTRKDPASSSDPTTGPQTIRTIATGRPARRAASSRRRSAVSRVSRMPDLGTWPDPEMTRLT